MKGTTMEQQDKNIIEYDLDNKHDVFDLIVDSALAGHQLDKQIVEQISQKLYEDRRGGNLADLWGNDEFLASLNWHTEN